MKINYLANIRFPMERANGIQTIQTCHALARAGVDVELTVRRSDDMTDEACLAFYGLPEHPNLRLHRTKTPFAKGLPAHLSFAIMNLARCRSDRFSVFYTRDLLLADLLLRFQFWHRLPVVFEAHTSAVAFAEEAPHLYTTFPAPTRGKLERLKQRETRVYRKVSRLVTITEALKSYLEERYGPLSPVEVIPDGAPVPQDVPPLRDLADGEGLRVAYIGQLYPWKGADTVLFAMKDLPEHELVIVGGLPPEPDLERTRKLARDLEILDRVSFRGYVPPTKIDEERRAADVFVVPLSDSTMSRHFTSPLKLFEAMAAGRPIVASDLPSIREVLTDGSNALLVPPGDPRALAHAIRRLASDRRLRADLARQAGEDIRKYSWDERGRRIASLLNDVVRGETE